MSSRVLAVPPIQSQMDAVRSALTYQFHAVIENQDGPVLPAQGQGLSGSGTDLILRGILHAQLYPAAAAFEGDSHGVEVGEGLRKVGDELYLKVHFPQCMVSVGK